MDSVLKNKNETWRANPPNLHGVPSEKAEYRQLCSQEKSTPLFSRDWWLDAAVGPENWQVVLAKINGNIVGALPLFAKQRYGMTVIQQPPLTPVLGPWIKSNAKASHSRLGDEQRIMQLLIENLPNFDHFRLTWNKGLSNWLPFYWSGFSQTTEYTYVIPALNDLDSLWKSFSGARRKHCTQGFEKYGLRVQEDHSIDHLLELHKMSIGKRGASQSFDDDCLRRIDAACVQHNCRKIEIVVDQGGRRCAGTYTVWDENCAYALIIGSDPEMRHTDAASFCQWAAIKSSAKIAPKYDFLGNMNPSIEPYVRSYGTEQIPIFTIMKTPSRLLRLRQGIKTVFALNS